MDLQDQLEVAAYVVTAVLGLWLGLTVATRSGSPAGRVFVLLATALAVWSSSGIVERLSTAPDVIAATRIPEELAAAIGIAGTLHFALVIAYDGLLSRRQRLLVGLAYAVLIAFAAASVVDPALPISITPPHLSLPFLPGAVIGWAWIIARLGVVLIAVAVLIRAARGSDVAPFRRRQLGTALAAVVTGAFGVGIRVLPIVDTRDEWIGVPFVAAAVVLATYAVYSSGIFFGAAVAGRAFRTSILGALTLLVVVAVVVLVDTVSRRFLGLDAPLLTVLVMVVAIALSGPALAAIQRVTAGGGPRAVARERLLRALGQTGLTDGPAAAGVQPALGRLARALDLSGLSVVGTDGAVVASEGTPPNSSAIRPVPLEAGGQVLGELRVGAPASGVALMPRDEELLQLSATYVATALLTGRREDEQIHQLARLAEDRAVVEAQAIELHTALAERHEPDAGLRVFALGPLRVERGDQPVERWGGDKAGTRQAEGLFAFLLDRGERGVAKDEVLELIWPDADLEHGDIAFHRTMGGLRTTLDPGRSGKGNRVIRFTNDRYRLNPAIVAWSDVEAFLGSVDAARAANDPREQVRLLEAARQLYRGEYLDDCPFYGDSVHVEQRRVLLRERYVDLAIVLGERYEAAGDRMSAAAAFRDAIDRSIEGCAPAELGIARLGL